MWRKQQNKSHYFWSTFGHSKVVSKTANGTEFLCQCLNVLSQNSVSGTIFGDMFLPNQDETILDPLRKVVV